MQSFLCSYKRNVFLFKLTAANLFGHKVFMQTGLTSDSRVWDCYRGCSCLGSTVDGFHRQFPSSSCICMIMFCIYMTIEVFDVEVRFHLYLLIRSFSSKSLRSRNLGIDHPPSAHPSNSGMFESPQETSWIISVFVTWRWTVIHIWMKLNVMIKECRCSHWHNTRRECKGRING